MREHSTKIALFVVLALFGPVASARSLKPHRKTAPVSEEVSTATRRRQGVPVKDAHGLRGNDVARHGIAELARTKAGGLSESARLAAEADSERSPVRPVPKLSELKADPVPDLPPIHVVHNRKIHYGESPETGVSHPPDEAIRTNGEDDPPGEAASAVVPEVESSVFPWAKTQFGSGAGVSGPKPGPPTEATATAAKAPLAVPIARVSLSRTAALPAGEVRAVKVEKLGKRAGDVKSAVPFPVAPALPPVYKKGGHLIVPPALKGSREILVRQNEMASKEGLDRIQDEEDLEHLRRQHLLVALPASRGLAIDERLPLNRRYCRPWTAGFLTELAKAHEQRFHTPLQVNSAVRTVEFQERLRATNGNAAPAEGEAASPHLTGQAIDLAKHGLSTAEIAWLRGYLLPLVQAGKVDVEEEFQQACFHISVYKKYAVPVGRRKGSF